LVACDQTYRASRFYDCRDELNAKAAAEITEITEITGITEIRIECSELSLQISWLSLLVGVGLTTATLLLLFGCANGTEMQTLRNDPISSLELPDAEVVQHSESNGGSSLGKPVAATITRVYAPTSGTRDELIEVARRKLEDLGWELTQPAPGMGYTATKSVGSNRINLNLTTHAGDTERVVIMATLGPA